LENRGKTKEERARKGRNSHESTNSQAIAVDPYAIIYHQLTLKGISGVGAKRLALIKQPGLARRRIGISQSGRQQDEGALQGDQRVFRFDPGRKQARHH